MEARKKLRVVLLGDFRVGKTSLLRQFVDHKFVEQPSNTPVLEDERTAVLKMGGREVQLLLTDTAGKRGRKTWGRVATDVASLGQEQFRSFTSSYFRDKDGYLVVFSVGDAASFGNLQHWIQEIRGWDESYRICVVGNKIDLEERAVTTREAEDFVATLGNGAIYLECSAKLNINCNKAFEEIARMCLGPPDTGTGTGTTPTTSGGNNASSGSSGMSLRDPAQQPEQRNFVCCGN